MHALTRAVVTKKPIPRAINITPTMINSRNTCLAIHTGRQAGIFCWSHLLPAQ